MTLLIIEHDIKTIMSVCDKVIILNRGEKLVEGTPEEVANAISLAFEKWLQNR